MASTFKNFMNNDIATTRTLLHEAIPITGSIVSGTYLEDGDNETNIKNYSHGQFQSVFDYPHLSSSANHIFDITMGYANESPLSGSGGVQNTEKINLYNQMAHVLVGGDLSGNVRLFDRNGRPDDPSDDVSNHTVKMDSVFFLNFARLLTKDEIKKGSFSLNLLTGAVHDSNSVNNNITRVGNNDGGHLILQDHNAASTYKVNSPAGEYGILYRQSSDVGTDNRGLGLLYYQAGIAVVTSSVFRSLADMTRPFSHANIFNGKTTVHDGVGAAGGDFGPAHSASFKYDKAGPFGMVPNSTLDARTGSVEACFVSASISASCGGFRNAIHEFSFNNTTELNSTIYFCRASHNEFNYSSNPTYVDQNSKIRVKENSLDQPVTYITSIGLYSADNELLAVAKLSEPIKKTPENELTFRVRLDY